METGTREFFLGGEMSPEDIALFRQTFDTEARRTRGLPDAERKEAITKAIKLLFEEKYKWIGTALAFMFVFLVDVDKGKMTLKPIKKIFPCCS
jgi:hypothetical protein